MKKSKLLAAALAATMFTTAACGLVACDDDSTRCVVTFNANGGTLIGDEALYTNASGIVKGALPTAEKEDGAFKGWALTANADESAVINLTKYKFDKDKTVYAVYKDYEVVTITFNANGGFCSRGSAQTVNGKLASLPTATHPDGKKFDGWFTAATGGERVTVDTAFEQAATVYAQYSNEEYTNYCLVGEAKYELEEYAVSGADAAYFICVDLSAGDTVSFYVDGQIISASVPTGGIWLGMKPSTGKKDVFTAELAGTFEFNITLSGTTPAWTVTADDGTILAIEGDYYIVGLGAEFGNWKKCLEKWHLGTNSGSVNLTVGATAATFKVVKATDRLGGFTWGGALGAENVTVGGGYVNPDTDGNIVLATAGTYTVTLVGGEIEITSDDVTEPEIQAVKGDYYIVGLGAEYGNWAKCLEAWHIGEKEGEIELTVGATPVSFKIVKCGNAYTATINWDGALGIAAVTEGKGYASTDKDKNIVLKTAGTYTITLAGGKISITSDLPMPEPTKDIDGYTYGAVVSTKYYLVGGFIGEDFDATHGYEMIVNPDNSAEYTVAGFTVEAGGAVKIVIGANSYGYANVHAKWGNKDLAETDEDGNIVFKEAGTYSIFINKTTHDIYLS